MGKIYVGTASWTDPTLTQSTLFYPSKAMSAEERLRFYASHFNAVEVDSTYYALPAERMVMLQTERTPADFKLSYKAFGALTRHPVDVRRLPKAVKAVMRPSVIEEDRLDFRGVEPEVLDLMFDMFRNALKPADEAGKLGAVLFQFPPYFTYDTENMDYIVKCKEKLPDYDLAIEFRHSSWTTGPNRQETIEFLRSNGLIYTVVDEPQFESGSTAPFIPVTTGNVSYVRFHGRNKEAWFKKGITTAERFAYLYSEEELGELGEEIRVLIKETNATYVLFNNCFQDYGVRNAKMMKAILS
jgi:uncharacterized protein YecE (DUF72 family)